MLSFRNSENTSESVGMKRGNGKERKEGRKVTDLADYHHGKAQTLDEMA